MQLHLLHFPSPSNNFLQTETYKSKIMNTSFDSLSKSWNFQKVENKIHVLKICTIYSLPPSPLPSCH